MNYKILSVFSTLILVLSVESLCAFTDKALFMGAIQFPSIIQLVPDVRVYCGGNKITCETDPQSKQVRFSVSENKYQTFFYVLITEDVFFETEDNTIKYLKISPEQPYKLYALELLKDKMGKDRHWRIKRQAIPDDTGRIPDQAIIVCYNPDYIDKLKGGNKLELPKIFVKNDIISLVGSEEKLHDLSVQLLLKTLHYDTMHTQISQIVKQKQPKTIVALNIN